MKSVFMEAPQEEIHKKRRLTRDELVLMRKIQRAKWEARVAQRESQNAEV